MNIGKDDIETKVIEVIRRGLQPIEENLHAQARLVDDLGADSLSLVELTIMFEETFDIEIPDEEAERIRTVRDAISAVERRLHTRRPARAVDAPPYP